MRIGGHHHEPNYPKLGTTLLIACCVILRVKTPKRAIPKWLEYRIRPRPGERSREFDQSREAVLGHLLKKDAGSSHWAKEPWYQATGDAEPK